MFHGAGAGASLEDPDAVPCEMRAALTETPSWVRLLDIDPDLTGSLDELGAAAATRDSRVGTWALAPGVWRSAADITDDIALYVISGALVRRVDVGQRVGVEMLGPGQVLRPAVADAEETIAAHSSWRVLTPTWVAVLDYMFWRQIAQHPEVLLALFDRTVLRSRSLAVRLAIVGIRNLPRRVLTLLWHLADTYGRVSGSGVVLELALSHDLLADLVAARRSSVSRAIKTLEQEGFLSRRPNRSFVLHGHYPVSDYRLVDEAVEPTPAAG